MSTFTTKIKFSSIPTLGCDPEYFFNKDGKVVGSEIVLPSEGLPLSEFNPEQDKTIIDGVQAEMNPRADTCRQRLAGRIGSMILQVSRNYPSYKIDISPLVDIDLKDLDKLSSKARVFGCTPSFNIYGDKPVEIEDSSKYPHRPAGGHLHLGVSGYVNVMKDTNKLVALLDIVLGNTCVLIDRHVGNVERRKNYGRAGEHRLPKHGLEYRTLSNFWLRDYVLMSFVFGLARQCIDIIEFSTKEDDYAKALIDAVNMDDVVNAINNNDAKLAMKNFRKIKPLLSEMFQENKKSDERSRSTLNKENMLDFLYFVKVVQEKGIQHYFSDDIAKNWSSNQGGAIGFEQFLYNKIRTERRHLFNRIKEKLQ